MDPTSPVSNSPSAASDIRQLYAEYVESIQGKAPSTIRLYIESAKMFLDFLNWDVLEAGEREVQRFQDHVQYELKYTSARIRLRMTQVRMFLRFLERRGARKRQVIELTRIRDDKRIKYTYTHEQYMRVLEESLKRKYSRHWTTIIIIGWNTGLRLGDCITLKWSFIDWENYALRLMPQKMQWLKQELEIPIQPELYEHLSFLYENRSKADKQSPYVMPYPATKWNAGGWNHIQLKEEYSKIRKAVGLPNHYFKALRRGFVTYLLNAGVDAKIIGSMTGHHIQTVYSYAGDISYDAKKHALSRARKALHASRMIQLGIEPPE